MTLRSPEHTAAFLENLDRAVDEEWERIASRRFWHEVSANGFSPALAQQTLVQLYHYTRYNPINQALALSKVDPANTALVRYCLEHAKEELGHEKMLVRDLQAMGLYREGLLDTPPLPASQALIGYLHYVADHLGAIPRLGYSYWAESAYDNIREMISAAKSSLQIDDRSLTFFVAHESIDAHHALEVREMLIQSVDSDELAAAVVEVARTTLYLTGQLLEDAVCAASGALATA